MTAKIALHVLASGMVLDRSVFVGQTVAEMKATLDTVKGARLKALTVIENGATFFTAANMLELIKASDQNYKLIAEKAGVTLRDDDVAAIVTAEATKKAIEAQMIPPIPPYPFATVPDGWKVTDYFELCNGDKSFRRKGRTESIGLVQAELIWRYLSEPWSKGGVIYSKYFRDNRVCQEGDDIRVGCQRAKRFEIEQIAIWRGWKFPEPAKK
jgi:hypothetical protein